MPDQGLLVSIVGPTASGKTDLGIELADYFDTDIISVDSRQFYREMNIGTAKPDPVQLAQVKHHFIDIRSVEETFNVHHFESAVLKLLTSLFEEKDIVVAVGGSGLYLHALWQGFDRDLPGTDAGLRKELQNRFEKEGIESLQTELHRLDANGYANIDQRNPLRLMRAIEICKLTGKGLSSVQKKNFESRSFDIFKLGLDIGRAGLYERINKRVDNMMEAGLLEEAGSLLKFRNKNALRTVGYQELFRYFDGEYSLEESVERIKTNSRKYAKRQMTWFRRYDDINWMKPEDIDRIIPEIEGRLNSIK